ncbi:MAG TPA: glycosyltransferase family 9 protein [Thermomicrobiales bacterium]|nr:glycosyltransferase family 9 protein [Thermomicrobiales bacterium]
MGARKPERILAIKLADLGDLLLCEPAFRSLRAAFPEARIDVLTTPSSAALLPLIGHGLRPIEFPKQLFDSLAGLTRPSAQVRAVRLALTLRSARYDLVVLLHHLTTAFGARKFAALAQATGCRSVVGLDNGRGTFLSVRVIDEGFGARHEATYMRDVAVAAGGISVDATPCIAVPQARPPAGTPSTPYATIFPVTGQYSRAREWSVQRFGAVATRLAAQGIIPLVVGAQDASEAAATIRATEPSTIDLTGRTSLEELAVVLAGAQVAVGGDTFIGHLAAAVGTPIVSIFGPSNARAWRPIGRSGTVEIVCAELPCQPCIYTGFRLGRPAGCPDRTCLKLVTTNNVASAVEYVLGGIG